jgi:hypothetical protein
MCGSIHATARNYTRPQGVPRLAWNVPRQRRGRQDVKRARYLEMSAFEALLSYREAPMGTLCQRTKPLTR